LVKIKKVLKVDDRGESQDIVVVLKCPGGKNPLTTRGKIRFAFFGYGLGLARWKP
jgi:hypothetical protein